MPRPALAVLACWAIALQQAVPVLPAACGSRGRAPPPWHAADRPAAMAARTRQASGCGTSRGCGRGLWVAMRCLHLRGGVGGWSSYSSSAVSEPSLEPGEHWPSDFSSNEVDPETGLKGDVPPGSILPRRFEEYSSERRPRLAHRCGVALPLCSPARRASSQARSNQVRGQVNWTKSRWAQAARARRR